MMRIVRYLDEGRTRISLVDDDWLPVSYYSSIYLNQILGGIPSNTKEKKAYELKFLLRWMESKNIDLLERTHSGAFLLPAEVHAFSQAAKMKVGTVLADNIIRFHSYTDKALSNAIHAASIQRERVKPVVTNGRISTAIEYVEYLCKEIHSRGRPPAYVTENCDNTVANLIEGKIKTSRASLENPQIEKSRSSIPENIFNKFLEIIDPASPENPFKHSKLRNALVIKLLITTGIRKGAVAKLKISDCDFTGDCDLIYITRTPDDINDPRKNKPSQKTEAHTSSVDPELMRKIDYYIANKRSRYPEAAKHEFVFVSEMSTKGIMGQPLTTGSFNYIFKVLSDALDFNVYPHLLRHKWNERFTEDTEGMPKEEVDQLRKYAMGWSRNSQMADLYNTFKIAQKVREIQSKRQNTLMNRGI